MAQTYGQSNLTDLYNQEQSELYIDPSGIDVNIPDPDSDPTPITVNMAVNVANSTATTFGSGINISSPPITLDDSTTYTDVINNTPDGSLLEQLWESWSSPTNADTQFGGNINVQASVDDVNSQLQTLLNNKSISSVISGVSSGIAGIASSIVGIPNYAEALGSLGSSDIGLSAPSNGYTAQYTSAEPQSVLESSAGKQFPNAGLSGITVDTYNATTLEQASGSANNSNATYGNAANDLIAFYFSDIVNGQFIPFRATLTNLTIDNATLWTPVRYVGRADRLFVYEGFEKTISFGFKVYANSPEEMAPMWARINYLVSLTSPSDYTSGTAGSNFIVPPFVKLTIGDLQKNLPICITAVNVSVPEDASWELTADAANYSYLAGIIKRTAVVGQLPMYVEISISANVLEKFRPRAGNLQFSDLSLSPNTGNALIGSKGIRGNDSSVGSNSLGNVGGQLGNNSFDSGGGQLGSSNFNDVTSTVINQLPQTVNPSTIPQSANLPTNLSDASVDQAIGFIPSLPTGNIGSITPTPLPTQ